MPDFADVVRIGSALPGVEQGTFYGTAGLKVRGKGFCRVWSEREHDRDGVHDSEVLVVFCDPDEKDALIDSLGGVVFSTPHYDGHGAMLVRLDDVDPGVLADLLADSWREKAPAALVRDLDETPPSRERAPDEEPPSDEGASD